VKFLPRRKQKRRQQGHQHQHACGVRQRTGNRIENSAERVAPDSWTTVSAVESSESYACPCRLTSVIESPHLGQLSVCPHHCGAWRSDDRSVGSATPLAVNLPIRAVFYAKCWARRWRVIFSQRNRIVYRLLFQDRNTPRPPFVAREPMIVIGRDADCQLRSVTTA